jgi:hypothetical protein
VDKVVDNFVDDPLAARLESDVSSSEPPGETSGMAQEG